MKITAVSSLKSIAKPQESKKSDNFPSFGMDTRLLTSTEGKVLFAVSEQNIANLFKHIDFKPGQKEFFTTVLTAFQKAAERTELKGRPNSKIFLSPDGDNIRIQYKDGAEVLSSHAFNPTDITLFDKLVMLHSGITERFGTTI